MVARAPSMDALASGRRGTAATRPQPSRHRLIRAYVTTFEVLASYLFLRLMRGVRGDAWYRERIEAVHQRNARRVERSIVALQGLFIKVGQLLSILANFLPDAFRHELEGLQDQVPPRPFDEIEARLVSDFGKGADQLFRRFDRAPLASASLGQVHEAELFDGTRVAVKVQHRDVERTVRIDLGIIRRILLIVRWFVPVRGLDAYYEQVRQMIERELDFQAEAEGLTRIAANFANDPMMVLPSVVRERSTRHVLTTTFVDGVKVSDLAALDALGVDRPALARRIVRAYCQMIFVDGVYHADPHPGNLLVTREGQLVLLDFGAIAELSPAMREGIPEFLEGVVRRDTRRLLAAMKKMGFLARGDDDAVSERVVEFFHRRFQEEIRLESFNLKDVRIDPQRGLENLLDLQRMDIGLRELTGAFHVPRDWVLLERTLLLLTGVCTQLDPDLEPINVIRPYLQEFVFGDRDWTRIAVEAVKDTVLQAITIPEDLRKYLTRANRGELEVRVRGLSDGVRALQATLRQAIWASIGIACGISALVLHLHGEDALARECMLGVGASGVLFLLAMALAPTVRR